MENIHQHQYNCQDCDKTFDKKAALNEHSKSHEILKPLSCQKCGGEFSKISYLQTHMATKHPLPPIPQVSVSCSKCSEKFVSRDKLNSHRDTQCSRENNDNCGKCKQIFVLESLVQHLTELKKHKC